MNRFLHTSLPLLLVFLAACTEPAPPAPQAVKPVPVVDTPAAVKAIRTAGDGLDSAVQVQPLRDPGVEGFLTKARNAEHAGDYAAALEATNGALKLAPDAPDIVQFQAELEIERNHWLPAEQLAIKSFTLGPKVGNLCARNWQTVIEARKALNDAATVASAKQRLKECRVAPRLRM